MVIRKLALQDKEQLKKLLEKFYIKDVKRFSKQVQDWEAYKNKEETIEKTANDYVNEDKNKFITYVVEEDNKLLGYIRGEIKERPYKILDKEGYVQDWFVDPKYQGKKIGKQLFNKLTGQFKKTGCTHILLDTLIENKKAINIYHKMRFKDKALILIKEI